MSLPEWILLFRAALAAAVGFAIGWEREAHGSPAGDRTLALVAMGAALLTGMGLLAFPENADRIVGGVITGIGFLGTGVIMRDHSGEVRGLTSAACIWTVAAIGVVIGTGHYWLGLTVALLVMILLLWDNLTIAKRIGLVRRPAPRVRSQLGTTEEDKPASPTCPTAD